MPHGPSHRASPRLYALIRATGPSAWRATFPAVIASKAKQSRMPDSECHAPRRRGIQYAVAYRSDHCCLWNTGSPAPVRNCAQGGVMTTEYDFAISRRVAPEVCCKTSRPPVRGRREDRVLAAPAVSRAICANKSAHEHTGQREHSGLPCAMALRLTSCSSRRTALLPPSPREKLRLSRT